jgi:acetaldehyde dehydrogenase (acetylating)
VLRDEDLVSIQEAREMVEKAYAASREFLAYTQEQVDSIVAAMAQAAARASRELAEEAVAETGYGVAADKLQKNLLCSERLHEHIKGMKTVGIVREDAAAKIVEIATPVGVVAAVLPTTNPTSTAMYKSLISVKGRNAVVISPHPNAVKCICHTAAILYQAARAAGAPENVIQCLTHSTFAGTQELMKHKRTGVILATGGHGVVHAAYSSGKPAFGVGPGNVPALIEKTADVRKAVADVVRGTTFDNGTLCSSEQAIVACESLREQVMAELKANGAYFVNEREASTLAAAMITPNFTVNPKYVGKAAAAIAQMVGIPVPPGTRVLVAPLHGVGRDYPLSAEKLSPVLSLYFAATFGEALDRCESLLRFGGMGHTCSIHSQDEARIRQYGLRMPAFRVVVNSPSTMGSVGITTNLPPAMTLGCGAVGGNVTSDNIGPQHLINLKRVAWEVRTPPAADSNVGQASLPAVLPPAEKQQATMPAPPNMSPINKQTVAEIVAQFAAKHPPEAPPAKAVAPPAKPAAPAPVAAAPPPPPAPPAPKLVDFVSESDVRIAMNRNEKIAIGPKTIVTPAARDLAAVQDTLVMHHR